MLATFRRGVHPNDHKEMTKHLPLYDYECPKDMFISVSQHIGAPAQICVEVGQRVLAGTLIAKAPSFVSANVYSSISGEVKGIVKRPNVFGVMVDHIHIENDFLYQEENLPILDNPGAEEILQRIQEAGIVGMGGATFPTHVKLRPTKKVDTLIINAAECEPYINCDYRILLEMPMQIIKGVKILKKALNVENAYIGIENNKKDAIELIKKYADSDINVVSLKTKYPQGAEKQLIYACTKREVPIGALPMDAGCVVCNLQTNLSVYFAVTEGKPLYKRAMTIAGSGIENPANVWMRNGVSFSDIYEKHKGNIDEKSIVKVISGGPMMGITVPNLDLVTVKGTSALLFMQNHEVNRDSYSACINCSACAKACPMHLMPMFIDQYTEIEDAVGAKKYGALNCILCGCCAYACPAKRPLVQSMKRAKDLIKQKGV